MLCDGEECDTGIYHQVAGIMPEITVPSAVSPLTACLAGEKTGEERGGDAVLCGCCLQIKLVLWTRSIHSTFGGIANGVLLLQTRHTHSLEIWNDTRVQQHTIVSSTIPYLYFGFPIRTLRNWRNTRLPRSKTLRIQVHDVPAMDRILSDKVDLKSTRTLLLTLLCSKWLWLFTKTLRIQVRCTSDG